MDSGDDETVVYYEDPHDDELKSGDHFGEYLVVQLLGRGGMGTVYEMEHRDLGTRFAVKLIHRSVAAHGQSEERFRREAQAMARLKHKHIVHVDDYRQMNGRRWLRMELVRGSSLSERMKARAGNAFPEEEVHRILTELLSGLAHAHDSSDKMVHRDLKPANILLDENDQVKITDFGLVRFAGEKWLQSQVQLTVLESMVDPEATVLDDEADFDPDATVLDEKALSQKSKSKGTSTRALMGTFAYMSPEQKRGEEAGVTSDLYSVGLIGYQLLTGFESLGLKLPSRVNKALDPLWDDWVEKATEVDYSDRFSSAREMLEAMPKVSGSATGDETGKGSPGGAGNTEIENVNGSGKIATTASGDSSRRAAGNVEIERGDAGGGEKIDSNGSGGGSQGGAGNTESASVAGSKKKEKRGTGLLVGLFVFAFVLFGGAGFWYFILGGKDVLFGTGDGDGAGAGVALVASDSDSNPDIDRDGTGVEIGKGLLTGDGVGLLDVPAVFRLEIDPVEARGRLWIGSLSDVAFADGAVELEDLEAGEQELILKAPGYQTYTTRVEVSENGGGLHEVKLVAVKGSLEVRSDPGVSVVVVDAGGVRRTLGETNAQGILVLEDVLTIGEYRLELSKARHESKELKMELMLGRTAKVEADLLPNPGELRVFTVPEGAGVFLDGKDLGKSPLTLRNVASEKRHELEVRLSGYRREKQEIELSAEEVRNVDFGTLAAESGNLLVKSDMEGFNVLLNGELVKGQEVSNGMLYEGLEIGSLSLAVTHPDYEDWKKSVRIEDEKTTRIDLNLKPKPGNLSVSVSPASADWELFLNGKAMGKQSSYRLPAEENLGLSIRAKGYLAAEKSSRLKANGSERWSVGLKEQPGPVAGSDWSVELPGGSELSMKWIRSGSFTMGSPSNESGRDSDEKQRQVRISRGYWLGTFEVTVGEWEAVMGNNPSSFKASGKRAPVEKVSWNDAMAFCKKLNERERAAGRLPEGYAYTLPTEAEWEYACRAGTATRFYTGNNDSDLDRAGWYSGNAGGKTHPVGEKVPNAWGLYDMHGNVWEWCYDWYGDYSGSTVTDPTGPSSGSNRVLRGGSWGNFAQSCRSAYRSWDSPGFSYNDLGFRLALSSRK